MTAKPAKKTATLPPIKKPSEKAQKEMVSRHSKLTDIAQSALISEVEKESVVDPVVKESAKQTTASLPPAAKKAATPKSPTQTTPSKKGKLELDELLDNLGKKKAPTKPPVDFRPFYK